MPRVVCTGRAEGCETTTHDATNESQDATGSVCVWEGGEGETNSRNFATFSCGALSQAVSQVAAFCHYTG